MERYQLINKWFNELNMQIQPESVREKFLMMVNCLDDDELMRPFFVIENTRKTNKLGTRAIAIRYKVTRAKVREGIRRAAMQPSISR